MGKLILEGVFTKPIEVVRGRIYPKEVFVKHMSELLNSGGKVSSTHGCVTKLGSELYVRFGSSEEEQLNSYEAFAVDGDDWIALQAVQRVIEIRTRRIKIKYT